jgi:hypothetical protein
MTSLYANIEFMFCTLNPKPFFYSLKHVFTLSLMSFAIRAQDCQRVVPSLLFLTSNPQVSLSCLPFDSVIQLFWFFSLRIRPPLTYLVDRLSYLVDYFFNCWFVELKRVPPELVHKLIPEHAWRQNLQLRWRWCSLPKWIKKKDDLTFSVFFTWYI